MAESGAMGHMISCRTVNSWPKAPPEMTDGHARVAAGAPRRQEKLADGRVLRPDDHAELRAILVGAPEDR